ncbi:hypothetical protein FRX31_005925 [Thalictrum thalictroides]|uniref:Cyclin C-terminal domain-containing protein n=1 Tax=Thalictrum thalictroides TaxID=46969 RepID=A0A7J6X6P3_THATH|nr:hypothetical protein FRX31_005925 [Thalictrum thalictroides]
MELCFCLEGHALESFLQLLRQWNHQQTNYLKTVSAKRQISEAYEDFYSNKLQQAQRKRRETEPPPRDKPLGIKVWMQSIVVGIAAVKAAVEVESNIPYTYTLARLRWRIWYSFMAELGLMHFELISYSPSMMNALAIYAAHCTMNRNNDLYKKQFKEIMEPLEASNKRYFLSSVSLEGLASWPRVTKSELHSIV